jgi:hypothetical protein
VRGGRIGASALGKSSGAVRRLVDPPTSPTHSPVRPRGRWEGPRLARIERRSFVTRSRNVCDSRTVPESVSPVVQGRRKLPVPKDGFHLPMKIPVNWSTRCCVIFDRNR